MTPEEALAIIRERLADMEPSRASRDGGPYRSELGAALELAVEALTWLHHGEHEWSAPPDALAYIERAILACAEALEGENRG